MGKSKLAGDKFESNNPFTMNKKTTEPTNIWLLSLVGKGTTGIHSWVK